MNNAKKKALFWAFVAILYALLLVQVRRYRDGSDWFFFVHLARQLIAGNLSNIYQEKEYGQYYFYYGPVSLLLLAPAVWAGDLFSLSPLHQQMLHVVPFSVFDVLMAISVVGFIKEYRHLKFTEELSLTAFIIFMYFTLWSTLYNGRFESVALTFLFIGLRFLLKKRFVVSALFLTVALLTKQTVLFAMIPFLVATLKRKVGEGVKVIGIVIATASVGLSPFFFANPQQFLTAMGSQVQMGIGGFSIWRLISRIPNLESFLSKYFAQLLAGFFLLVGLFAWKMSMKPHDKKIISLMTICVLGAHLFMKTFLSYYFVFPLIILFVWEITWYRFPIMSFIYLGIATMIHTLGMSVETTAYHPGVLNALIAFVLGFGVMIPPAWTLFNKEYT